MLIEYLGRCAFKMWELIITRQVGRSARVTFPLRWDRRYSGSDTPQLL